MKYVLLAFSKIGVNRLLSRLTLATADRGFLIFLVFGCVFTYSRAFVAYAALPKWFMLIGLTCLWGICRFARPNSLGRSLTARSVDVATLGMVAICVYAIVRIFTSDSVRMLPVCITLSVGALFCLVRYVIDERTIRVTNYSLIAASIALSVMALGEWVFAVGEPPTGPFDSPAGLAICIATLYPFLCWSRRVGGGDPTGGCLSQLLY